MRSAAVYLLKDRILLHPYQTTPAGFGLAGEPYTTLPTDCDVIALGTAVRDILNLAGYIVPQPASSIGLSKPRLQAAGVKSEAAFQRGSKYVAVEHIDGTFRIEPTHNGGTAGASKGFTPINDAAVFLAESATAGELGDAVKQAFDTCT